MQFTEATANSVYYPQQQQKPFVRQQSEPIYYEVNRCHYFPTGPRLTSI